MTIVRLSLTIRYFMLLLAPTFGFILPIHAQSEKDFFIKIYPDKETLYEGDSLVLSVVLHASYPIAKAEETHPYKTKGKYNIRPLLIDKRYQSTQMMIDNQAYYTLIWKQYVIRPHQNGKILFESPSVKGILKEMTNSPSWIDQMMGIQPEYKSYTLKAKAATFSIEVKERPLRSTLEMMQDKMVF